MGSYEAEIRRTADGVPHIRANDWGSLGYGQGWACAQDNIGTIIDMAVKTRSQRSLFHGPGPDDNFLASDFGYRQLNIDERARTLRDAQSPTARALIDGYRAGCNAWLAQATASNALPQWCANAAWLTPLDELDLYRNLVDATLLASGRNLVALIGRAEAPGENGPVDPSPMSALQSPNGASNGWAFGGDATKSGGGLVLANPHFPWYGEARFWECHLQLPGELDVYGVSLVGIPLVQIGFNAHVGWTHTFSRGSRFTLSGLTLVPGDPTKYRHGDDELAMTPTTHHVTTHDGTEIERTLWHSHHGPMVNLPLLGWGTDQAFTYRDANVDNTAMIEMYLGMCRATSMDEFRAAIINTQGMPWANTLASDTTGQAWYMDASATPNLSQSAQQRYLARLQEDPIAALLAANRVPLFDGSNPDDDWIAVEGSRSPGLVPTSELPELWRRDVVINANDSHWIANPEAPLVGYPVLCGRERVALSLRTRQNLLVTQALCDRGEITIDAVLDEVFADTSLSATLLRDGVIARCRAEGSVAALRVAAILSAWDGTYARDAVGATLWREFMASFDDAEYSAAGRLFGGAFDPDNPMHTPIGLAAAPQPATIAPDVESAVDPIVLIAVGALALLESAGIDPDAPLGDVQWATAGDARVPVPGGGEVEGIINVLAPVGSLTSHSLAPRPGKGDVVPGRTERTGLTQGGYRVDYGASFLMAVEMTPDGPIGKGLVAYGPSDDPADPRNAAAIRAYASELVRPLRFRDVEIDADPACVTQIVSGT